LDRDEALFEHAEIGRGKFELRLALRSSAEAREVSRRVGSSLAQSLPQAGIKGRALEGRTASANKAHDEFEQQEQKPDLRQQAKDRQAAAETAEEPIPEQQPNNPAPMKPPRRPRPKPPEKKPPWEKGAGRRKIFSLGDVIDRSIGFPLVESVPQPTGSRRATPLLLFQQ
jgi:hypothetical protein